MRKTKRIVGSLILALALGTPATAQDSAPEDQLVRLETHLEKIRKEYEFNRVMGGGSLVATGTLIGIGGTLLAQSMSFTVYDVSQSYAQAYETQMRYTLMAASWLYGSVFIVPGVLTLVLKSDYETLPERFQGAPATSAQERRDKVTRGEVILQSLSDKARSDRWLSAGLSALSGASMVYLGYQQSVSYGSYSPLGSGQNSFLQSPSFVSGMMFLGAALIRMAIPSTPENENRAYERWKAGFTSEAL